MRLDFFPKRQSKGSARKDPTGGSTSGRGEERCSTDKAAIERRGAERAFACLLQLLQKAPARDWT